MPILIKNTDQYLYEKQRDIFVLQIKNQSKEHIFFDRDSIENKAIISNQLSWLDSKGVKYEMTADPSVICGWTGAFYVDFDGWDDPIVAEYSYEFEDANGKSKTPDKFSMVALSYQYWKDNDGIERIEQNMKDWNI